MARLSASPHKRAIESKCLSNASSLHLGLPQAIDEQSEHSTPLHSPHDSVLSLPKSIQLQDHTSPATQPSFKNLNQGPLVLLHATILPLPEQWSQVTFSEGVTRQLSFLRASLRTDISSRGVLVQHPGADFLLLQERVIAALGFPADEDDPNEKSDWDIRVYAASGLLTRPSWAVAYEEMERVDIAIVPRLSEDERSVLEAVVPQQRSAEMTSLESRIVMLEDQLKKKQDTERRIVTDEIRIPTKQVPLDVLLRNYLYLLAKDVRNLVIAALLLLYFMSGPPQCASLPAPDARLIVRDACDLMAKTMIDALSSISETHIERVQWMVPSPAEVVMTKSVRPAVAASHLREQTVADRDQRLREPEGLFDSSNICAIDEAKPSSEAVLLAGYDP